MNNKGSFSKFIQTILDAREKLSPEQKIEFDERLTQIIKEYLPEQKPAGGNCSEVSE